jgi:hypothetical protein
MLSFSLFYQFHQRPFDNIASLPLKKSLSLLSTFAYCNQVIPLSSLNFDLQTWGSLLGALRSLLLWTGAFSVDRTRLPPLMTAGRRSFPSSRKSGFRIPGPSDWARRCAVDAPSPRNLRRSSLDWNKIFF